MVQNDQSPTGVPLCLTHRIGMELKTARSGNRFWGCPKYNSPERCRETKPFAEQSSAPGIEISTASSTDAKGTLEYEDPGSCPGCGSAFVLRARRDGGSFWSCSSYPTCKGATDAIPTGAELAGVRSPALQTRVNWIDGTLDRPGWTCRYTTAGGSLRSSKGASKLAVQMAQCWIAQQDFASSPSDEAVFLSSVLAKIVQRGTSPPIHPEAESLLLDRLGLNGMAAQSATPGDLAVILDPDPVSATPSDLVQLGARIRGIDANLAFGSPDERTFAQDWFDQIERGALSRWLIPQVQFAALVPNCPVDLAGQRVDFLLSAPGLDPLAIEIDGRQHEESVAVDTQRAALLEKGGIKVIQVPVAEVRKGTGPKLKLICDRLENATRSDISLEQRHLILTPVQLHRFMLGIISGLRTGLIVGDQWTIELTEDQTDIAGLLAPYWRLIRAVDAIWGTNACASQIFVRTGGRVIKYDQATNYDPQVIAGYDSLAQLSIRLEIGRTALDALDAPNRNQVPQMVIRSARLPALVLDDIFEGTHRRFVKRGRVASLRPALVEVLRAIFAKSSFLEGQYEGITQVLSGGNCAVLLPTGGGKSLIYQLAGLLLPGRTLVVDPLVALMEDQIRGLMIHGVDRVVAIAYRYDREDQEELLRKVKSGDALFVFVQPERLQKSSFRAALRSLAQSSVVNLAVIDEAHCVSEWGHNFRLSYLTLGKTIRQVCRDASGLMPPIVALTGTASRAVLRDVLIQLEVTAEDEYGVIKPNSFDRPELRMWVIHVDPAESEATLTGVIRSLPAQFGLPAAEFFRPRGRHTAGGIVFCPHVSHERGVVRVRDLVRSATNTVPEIYSGQPPKDLGKFVGNWDVIKRKNAQRFIDNESSIMVTTNAFGMGIDKPNVRFVIHYGLPGSIEAYYQEVGRAGRDKKKAICTVLLTEVDQQRSLRLLGPDLEAVRAEHRAVRKSDNDDITRSMYFLLDTFKGVDVEVAVVAQILGEIERQVKLGRSASLELPLSFISNRKGAGSDEGESTQRERAIYRLMILGVIEDYTKEQKFTIQLRATDADDVLDHLNQFMRKHFPQSELEIIAEGRSNLADFTVRCAERLIDRIYQSIVRSRSGSLNEMYLAARAAARQPNLLRQRVLDYLTQGDLSPVLEQLLKKKTFSFEDWRAVLASYGARDAGELRGTTARLLTGGTGHPGLMYARAYAEGLHPNGEVDTMLSFLRSAFRSGQERYGVTTEQIEKFFSAQVSDLKLHETKMLLAHLIVAEEFDVAKVARETAARRILVEPGSNPDLKVVAMRVVLSLALETVKLRP